MGLIDDANLIIQELHGVEQRATYNGHKRFSCLKFEAVVAPGGLMLHLYVDLVDRRQDLTLFRYSNLSVHLSDPLKIDGV